LKFEFSMHFLSTDRLNGSVGRWLVKFVCCTFPVANHILVACGHPAFLGYSSLPRANHSVPDPRLDGQGLLTTTVDGTFCMENNIPLLETVSEDQEVHAKLRNPGESAFLSLRRLLLHSRKRAPRAALIFSPSMNSRFCLSCRKLLWNPRCTYPYPYSKWPRFLSRITRSTFWSIILF